MCVRNEEYYLPTFLSHIRRYVDGFVVLDDGSTDNSGKICNQYASKDSRVRTIHQKNMGLSEARNTGCVMLQVII